MSSLVIAQAAEKRIKEQIGDLVFANALLVSEVAVLRERINVLEARMTVTVNGDT